MRILGHETVIDDLAKLAEKSELSHGYIFYGPSMVGKRTAALGLANFLEKQKFEAVEPNEVLQDMQVIDFAFMKRLDPDTIDSVGIDAVREIKNFLWQKPNTSTKRTLVVDDAERLTTEAQNALLKITEEPPVSSLLLIVTSDPESMIPTILSRLQKVYFGPVPEEEIAGWLVEEEGLLKAKAGVLAKRAMGKPGLAWRLLHDRMLQANLELAEKFLRTSAEGRRDFIKKLIEPEEFNLRSFLDAVIMVLAWEKPSMARTALWHKTLALYEAAANFGLNPRLQLMNLLL